MDVTSSGTGIQVSMPVDASSPQQVGAVAQRSNAENSPDQSPRLAQEESEEVREHANSRDVSLSFSTYGKKNEKISVKVIDKETGEVIREVPSEELQQLSGKLEEIAGMVFDGTV